MCIMPGEMQDRVEGAMEATADGQCPRCGASLHIDFWVTRCLGCGWRPGCHPDDHGALAKTFESEVSKR